MYTSASSCSRAAFHHAVEEIWYSLQGHGQLWRKHGTNEETVDLRTGASVTIPPDTHFQFRDRMPSNQSRRVSLPWNKRHWDEGWLSEPDSNRVVMDLDMIVTLLWKFSYIEITRSGNCALRSVGKYKSHITRFPLRTPFFSTQAVLGFEQFTVQQRAAHAT
jgi:hypothetical protein